MLREQRNRWRERFKQGDTPTALFLNDYRRNRDREDWRISTQAEEVCEYVLWLESELGVDNDIQDWANDVRKNAHQEDRSAIKEYWLGIAENIESESLKAKVIQMTEEFGR